VYTDQRNLGEVNGVYISCSSNDNGLSLCVVEEETQTIRPSCDTLDVFVDLCYTAGNILRVAEQKNLYIVGIDAIIAKG